MRIQFDPGKDAANRTKHGFSLAFASELDWDDALVWVDERQAYGETRMIALAPRTGTSTALRSWTGARCVESSACGAPTEER